MIHTFALVYSLLLVTLLQESLSLLNRPILRSRALKERTISFLESGESTEWDISLKSPCKLNLFLRILGRRENGFHDLASLFQTISLSDQLYFKKLPKTALKDEMVCSDSSLTVDDSNLVIKALNLMRQKTKLKNFFKVYLDKTVPMQAGLGGGSGNAATAMHAFNVLSGYPGSLEDLIEWSGDIGSDISFFFSSGTAYCTGRGEIVQSLKNPLPDTIHTEVHVFKPKEGLSTGLVFNSLDLKKCDEMAPEEILKNFEEKGALKGAWAGFLINDLEKPAFLNAPLLAALKEKIIIETIDSDIPYGVSGVMMSGSGTSVYALRDKRFASGSGVPLPIDKILADFPGLKHFQCDFIQKENSIESWYK